MRLEAKKYLFDIQISVGLLGEIIGEALAQLARLDSQLVARISEYRRIIAFRNILIHGYADVDNRLVWSVLETKLPALRREIGRLLAED